VNIVDLQPATFALSQVRFHSGKLAAAQPSIYVLVTAALYAPTGHARSNLWKKQLSHRFGETLIRPLRQLPAQRFTAAQNSRFHGAERNLQNLSNLFVA
jgi:hypothetical protein